MSPSVASLFFCLLVLVLVLPAKHGASSHASYKLGSRQVVFKTPAGRSSGNSQHASTVPPATTYLSSIATDILRRDTSRIRLTVSSQLLVVADPVASTDIFWWYPSMLPVVLVSYGTPEQRFPVFLDTKTGVSMLRCNPCTSGSGVCDPAFDPSRSYTFTHVPCDSPDCPANCSGGSVCPFYNSYYHIEGSFAHDVLTLAPSMAIHDFRFACMDKVERPYHELQEVVGTLDLSRDRNSLPSRLSSSPAFSYCLPQSPTSQGFLYLGGNATIRDDNRTVHAPLVTNEGNSKFASMYFIDLVGMSLGGKDLPILPETFSKSGTNIDMVTAFTLLQPDAYTSLRDAFRKEMSVYNSSLSGSFAGFDTCYNFTGMDEFFIVPVLELQFGNGESLVINVDQMLYYDDTAGVACLAFFSFDDAAPFSVIGTYQLASTEVVYDVAGGKVGFIPSSC